MVGGYAGRIGFVDLSTGEMKEEAFDEKVARQYVGGYGLGVRLLFERQKPGIDPLGPGNILGFTTGPLTGTHTPAGGRYTAVFKSPLTGGWGDSNSGGHFGNELKAAGWDAVFFTGISPSPVYLLISNKGLELKDASHLWGKDTSETEEILREELGLQKLRVACIGPASEKLSLISGIVTDKGRIAARAGGGAVMGSKRLKAVAVHGETRVAVADAEKLNQLRKDFIKELQELRGFPKILMDHGTCGTTGLLVESGGAPIQNWLGAGLQAFPTAEKITDTDDWVIRYQQKRYRCANCPIACGGILNVSTGPYPVGETHKPEYETMAAFGPLCMNDDLFSIFKMNDMCNRSGLDTISAGSVLAFAMECFEKGIINRTDTDGIELTWGNPKAMIAMLEKIIYRQGLGDVLADGVKLAADRIGKGAEAYAIHIGGQEPGMHNALFLPSRGTGFVCDPTPGRHTAAPMARIDAGPAVIAPYPELQYKNFERYQYRGKGQASADVSCYWQVGACAGVCLFPVMFFGNFPLIDFINAVTGWEMTVREALQTGARIQSLRQEFNKREGIELSSRKLHPRMAGIPPMTDGPLKGITIDMDTLSSEYYSAMGWNPENGFPSEETLNKLGIQELVEKNSS
jgi:aldehyde:ferredoxin oxidoreductase